MNEAVQKEKDRYSCNLPFMSFCITKAQLSWLLLEDGWENTSDLTLSSF